MKMIPPAIFLITLFSIFPAGMLMGQNVSDSAESAWVINELNALREQHGLRPLFDDISSADSAILHARELADRQVLSHWGLDGSRVAERYRRAGGTGLSAGENLGAGDTLISIITAWMDSPDHRSNILDPRWYSAGSGMVNLPGGRVILVVVFNNSRWSQTSFRIEDNRILIQGNLFLSAPAAIPEAVYISFGDTDISPSELVAAGEEFLSLRFIFPRPHDWISGKIASMEMNVFERGRITETDLIFQEIP